MNPNETDSYVTIAAPLRARELKERSSRFIADLIPVSSKEEADDHLERIRKEFYDATHHCYAYRLGIHGELTRAADDGEPSGTAGKPILQVLAGAGLTNILCVVTRYFGGTKLGTGGLVRSYSEAAASAVAQAQRKEILLLRQFEIVCSYDLHSALERFLAKYEIAARSAEFGENVTVRVSVRKGIASTFNADLEAAFYGTVSISDVDAESDV